MLCEICECSIPKVGRSVGGPWRFDGALCDIVQSFL
jgi:hypothetical protein